MINLIAMHKMRIGRLIRAKLPAMYYVISSHLLDCTLREKMSKKLKTVP